MSYVQGRDIGGWGLGGSTEGDRRSFSLVGARQAGAVVRPPVSVVLELLRGADLESVSRRHGVTAAKLSKGRSGFLAGGEARLKDREETGRTSTRAASRASSPTWRPTRRSWSRRFAISRPAALWTGGGRSDGPRHVALQNRPFGLARHARVAGATINDLCAAVPARHADEPGQTRAQDRADDILRLWRRTRISNWPGPTNSSRIEFEVVLLGWAACSAQRWKMTLAISLLL
jgi:hypothetical protein